MVLGSGFVADHLPYDRISQRVQLQWYETKNMLSHYRPDILINCLGRTGRPNVDWCEDNKQETAEANVSIPIMLAEICGKLGIRMIHFGSGCIYFGESPHKMTMSELADDSAPYDVDTGWTENDFANPKSYYSKTKYACDLAIGSQPHVTVLRLRMPISNKDTSRNLINKLRGYERIIDIPNSVTFMDDLTRCVDWAVNNSRVNGVYHVVNPQPLSAAQIMKYYQVYDPKHQFSIISEEELDKITKAKRSNCLLNTDKLRNAGFQMTNTEDALKECMRQYARNIRRDDVK